MTLFGRLGRTIRVVLCTTVMVPGICTATPSLAADTDGAITVAAAASLTNVVEDLGKAFDAETGIPVRASFASSAVSARQIISGAPFDLVVSANRLWVEEIAKRDALDPTTISVIAANRLVIASSVAVETSVSPDELLAQAVENGWRIAIADPDSVPAGIYARQALESMGVWEDVRPALVILQNVRSVAAHIDRGETPIGLVYATDLRVAENLHSAAVLDDSLHDAIEYVGAVPLQAPSPGHGRAFLEFMTTPTGRAILADHGFDVMSHSAQ